MTHIFTDEEYYVYKEHMAELEELRRWKKIVMADAAEHVKGECWSKEPSFEGYCDSCVVGHILPECPAGWEKAYSK